MTYVLSTTQYIFKKTKTLYLKVGIRQIIMLNKNTLLKFKSLKVKVYLSNCLREKRKITALETNYVFTQHCFGRGTKILKIL